MGGELRQEAPATNGDSITITGLKIGGPLLRKTVLGLGLLGSGGGGVWSFVQMHNAEMEALKARQTLLEVQMKELNKGQTALLRHFGIRRPN